MDAGNTGRNENKPRLLQGKPWLIWNGIEGTFALNMNIQSK